MRYEPNAISNRKILTSKETSMRYEPRFDDPSRTADFGYFSWERKPEPVITKNTLAEAAETGIEAAGAPFHEWLPLVFEGWRFDLNIDEARLTLKAMLNNNDTYNIAMDILSDIAFEKYGADYE